MKHLLLGSLLVLLLGAGGLLQAQNNENIITVVYQVNLQNAGCKAKVEKNLPLLEGVKSVTADVEQKTVCVAYDGDVTSDEKIMAAFSNLGYRASVKTSCCCRTTQKCCDGTCPLPVTDSSGRKHCNN